jgi:hypothetical protein
MGKMVGAGAGAGAEIFDKLEPEPEPHKNGPAPQHCGKVSNFTIDDHRNIYNWRHAQQPPETLINKHPCNVQPLLMLPPCRRHVFYCHLYAIFGTLFQDDAKIISGGGQCKL